MAIINFYDSQLDIPKKVLCTHLLESKGLIRKVLKKKFNANVKITDDDGTARTRHRKARYYGESA